VGKCGTAGQGTDGNVIRHMRIACWIHKAINTHLQYVIHIAFPLQQWLHELASTLRNTYIACLFVFTVNTERREQQDTEQ